MSNYSYIDEKYIRQLSMWTDRFKDVGNGTYNCRCFICGDSERSEIKARGYFYQSKNSRWRYKCHNCAANKSIGEIFKLLSPSMYQDYRFECFEQNKGTVKKEISAVEKPIEYKNDTVHKLMSSKVLKELISLTDTDQSNHGYKYVLDRSIPIDRIDMLYYSKNIRDVVRHIPEYNISRVPEIECVVIPYFNNGLLDGFQIRNIDPKSPMRYLTYDLVDTGSHIYNIENINSDLPVYVFEGAFDSMFCNNAVAASGSSIMQKLDAIKKINRDIVVVFDNDYKVNAQIGKLLNSIVESGYSVVLYDDRMKGHKDINSYVLTHNKSKDEITEYLHQCTYSNLNAKLFLANQRRSRGSISWTTESNKTSNKTKRTVGLGNKITQFTI